MSARAERWLRLAASSALVCLACCAYARIIDHIAGFVAQRLVMILAMPAGCVLIHALGRRFPSKPIEPCLRVATTFLSHFCGASVGKESVGVDFGRVLSRLAIEDSEDIADAAGTSAAFSALFSTPFAGICYFFESRKRACSSSCVMPVIASSLFSWMLSRLLDMKPISYSMNGSDPFSSRIALCVLAGSALSATMAFVYARLSGVFRDRLIPGDPETPIVLSAVAVLLSFATFRVSGNRLVNGLSSAFLSMRTLEMETKVIAFCLVMKIVLTLVCFSAGFTGGDFIPLMVIGFLSGALVSKAAGIRSVLVPSFASFTALAVGKRLPLTSLLLLLQALATNFATAFRS